MTKKITILIFLAIFAVPCLAGCFRLNIGIGIDEQNRAYLSYGIVIDVSEIDPLHHDTLATALNSLGWHYQQELGFTVGVSTDGDEYTLTMRKMMPGTDFTDAFNLLKAMLTDESMSIFSQVDMAVQNFQRRDSYIAAAVLDTGHMLRISGHEQLPQELQDALADGLQVSGGEIVFIMPASEVEAHSGDVEMNYRSAVMTVPVNIEGQTAFELRGSVVYSGEGLIAGPAEEITGLLRFNLNTILIISGGVILLLLIIMLAKAVRVYKHNRLFGPE